jgi:hypothetical protein
MSGVAKQLSSAFSTGGGGVIFENRVQAAFVALMLSNGVCPCLDYSWPIAEVALQARHRGYETDDAVVTTRNDNTGDQCRLLVQVKHSIRFTDRDAQMPEVIGAAWRDFNNSQLFDERYDGIALVTGPLSKTDSDSICRLLELARSSSDVADFLAKKKQSKLCSDKQREKWDIIAGHVKTANAGNEPSDENLWRFLKRFYLLGFDMDLETGVCASLIQSLLAAHTQDDVQTVWHLILQEVQKRNPSAGVVTPNNVSAKLKGCFKLSRPSQVWVALPKPVPETLAVNLLGAWDEKMPGDREIIEAFSGMAFADWQAKVRDILRGGSS